MCVSLVCAIGGVAALNLGGQDRISQAVDRLLADEPQGHLRGEVMMDMLVERFGVESKTAIASALAAKMPTGAHATIARRAMFHSPMDAGGLIAVFPEASRELVVDAVTGLLPEANVYSAQLGDGDGDPTVAVWKTTALPAVQLRRRGGGGPFFYPRE